MYQIQNYPIVKDRSINASTFDYVQGGKKITLRKGMYITRSVIAYDDKGMPIFDPNRSQRRRAAKLKTNNRKRTKARRVQMIKQFGDILKLSFRLKTVRHSR